jgi:hypothetical protein
MHRTILRWTLAAFLALPFTAEASAIWSSPIRLIFISICPSLECPNGYSCDRRVARLIGESLSPTA